MKLTKPQRVQIGNVVYFSEKEVLDFLNQHASMALAAMRVRGTDLITTEFLRGIDTKLNEIIHDLSPPK